MRIQSNKLDVLSDGDNYWNVSQFGANQEAYVKLADIDPNASEIDLILKSQSSSGWGSGVIEILYNPGSSVVQVWTYTSSQGWVQRGSNISVSFSEDEVFGARAYANGTVEVYQNSTLIGTRDVSGWTYSANGGYIGLWTIGGNATYYDDFSGGTLSGAYVPSGKVLAAFMAAPVVRLNAKARQAGVQRTAALLTPPAGVIWRSYYYAGAARIALREDSDQGTEVYYLLTDHLGSTSLTYRVSDGRIDQQWYAPWGTVRQQTGELPTDYTFTGQRDVEELGLIWYQSRFYDPHLGRWSKPDTVVPYPGVSSSWDRFAYTRNNAVRWVDPTGHAESCGDSSMCSGGGNYSDPQKMELIKQRHNQEAINVDEEYDKLFQVASGTVIQIDESLMLWNFLQMFMGDTLSILGFASSCLEGAGVGCIAGLGFVVEVEAFMYSMGNVPETYFGLASLGITAISDWILGYSFRGDTGLYLGKDTLVAIENFALGQFPEMNVDFWAAGQQYSYDLDRSSGLLPATSVPIVSNGQLDLQQIWNLLH